MIPFVLVLSLATSTAASDDRLESTEPVVCAKVVGFRDYEVLDPPELTADEKLTVYYEPTGFTVRRDPKTLEYSAHISEDALVRKKGSTKAIFDLKKMVEYEPRTKEPIGTTYISSVVSLKGLNPGEYELDLILRDELDLDKKPIEQTIGFTVIAPPSRPESRPN